MLLQLVRDTFTPRSTTGILSIDHSLAAPCQQIYTLEPVVRPVKVPNETAIPEGMYFLKWRWSPKLRAIVPELQEVPGFSYVYIHWGNDASDTDGCILVGLGRGPDEVIASHSAWDALMARVWEDITNGKGWVKVSNLTGGRGVPLTAST